MNQTQALKAAFINYLQAKLAAGIINIPNPGSNQASVHVVFLKRKKHYYVLSGAYVAFS